MMADGVVTDSPSFFVTNTKLELPKVTLSMAQDEHGFNRLCRGDAALFGALEVFWKLPSQFCRMRQWSADNLGTFTQSEH